jgi:hypothetical protein
VGGAGGFGPGLGPDGRDAPVSVLVSVLDSVLDSILGSGSGRESVSILGSVSTFAAAGTAGFGCTGPGLPAGFGTTVCATGWVTSGLLGLAAGFGCVGVGFWALRAEPSDFAEPPAFGYASRNLRATGASTVEDADFTNSPSSFSLASTSLLVTPSSFASSCTRALPATALLVRVRPAAQDPRDLVLSSDVHGFSFTADS